MVRSAAARDWILHVRVDNTRESNLEPYVVSLDAIGMGDVDRVGGKNASLGEMIGKLTITYNRQRQAQITKELIEIISGAEAL